MNSHNDQDNRHVEPVNPFEPGSDRHDIWELLVRRDIEAFVAADWNLARSDFIADGFVGIDARRRSNPDAWALTYPQLDDYGATWLEQARELLPDATDPARDMFDATILRDIEVSSDTAIAHKKFDGWVRHIDGRRTRLDWQSIYVCAKTESGWKIRSFVGYLPSTQEPHVESNADAGAGAAAVAAIRVPEGASQHATAGPYSPVLTVTPQQIVVISGQAAIAKDGTVLQADVGEQTRATLENCRTQLASAGCGLQDVFKVNVYLRDLDQWGEVNEVYREYFTEPRPVRTAVGVDLLPGLLVEIELWAALAGSTQNRHDHASKDQ